MSFVERNKCCPVVVVAVTMFFFEIIIIVLLFPVVCFMQVHLYAYTHFYFEPAVRKKMTGTGDSKAHP